MAFCSQPSLGGMLASPGNRARLDLRLGAAYPEGSGSRIVDASRAEWRSLAKSRADQRKAEVERCLIRRTSRTALHSSQTGQGTSFLEKTPSSEGLSCMQGRTPPWERKAADECQPQTTGEGVDPQNRTPRPESYGGA